MTKIIGNINSEIGTIIFQINAGKFEIQTNYRKFFVTDEEIQFNNGKYFFDISKEHLALKMKEIEIPKIVIERKNSIFQETSGEKKLGKCRTRVRRNQSTEWKRIFPND